MIPLHIEIAKSILATPRNFASDEFTFHSRIEQAYEQPRLFEDEKTIPKQDILI